MSAYFVSKADSEGLKPSKAMTRHRKSIARKKEGEQEHEPLSHPVRRRKGADD
jgi:hypothetical protein